MNYNDKKLNNYDFISQALAIIIMGISLIGVIVMCF